MESRVPVVDHYNELRSPAVNSFIGSASLHDLNAADAIAGTHSDVVDRAADHVTQDSLDDGDDSSADCMHESYRSSIPLHSVGVEEDQASLENSSSSTSSYNILTIDDVSPIETARARFLDIIVDHFINPHVVEVSDTEADFMVHSAQTKLSKRKSREIHYEGDARFVLPLMYVANMYETLVNEVNIRLCSLNGMREKTIGVALEAAGGLYRKLAKKFPRKGPCTFKRRELATSFETRSRFPELVIQEEKRVRFVVVNGLAIVEKPTNMQIDDAEWFKRLTGRNEVAVSAGDYKFYAPRHKYRRVASSSICSIPGLPAFTCTENSSLLSNSQGCRSVSDEKYYAIFHCFLCCLAAFFIIYPSSGSHRIHSSLRQNICNYCLIRLSFIPCSRTIPTISIKVKIQLSFLTASNADHHHTCLILHMPSSPQPCPNTLLACRLLVIWEDVSICCLLVLPSIVMNVELPI